MQPTTQHNTLRSVLIFGIIGVVLLGAIVLGMRWAKERSDQLGQQNGQPAATEQQKEQKSNEPQQEPTPAASAVQNDSQETGSTTPQTSSTATQTPAVQTQRVPSTGVEDIVLPISALGLLAFAIMMYMQSRRRLLSSL